MDSPLRNTLKTLCCCNGWSYAIFWRFDPRNSLLLTAADEDAYYNKEQQLEEDMRGMLAQVHLLGQGIVGQAAFTGKHRWMVSNAKSQRWNFTRDQDQDLSQDDSQLRQLFFSEIKTIVVVSVKPWGVVQFGSNHKISERLEFLEQIQRVFSGIEDVDALDPSENAASPLDCENYDLNELLSSFTCSENSCEWNLNSLYGDGSGELMANVYSSKNPEEGDAPIHGDISCFSDQLTAVSALSYRTGTDVFLKSNSSMDSLIATGPCFGTCSGEVSSLEPQLVPQTRTQDVADMCSLEANTFVSSKLTVENFHEDSAPTSLYSKNGLLGQRGTFQHKLGNSLDNQHSPQSTIVTEDNFAHGISNNLKPVGTSENLSKFRSMDDLCRWFAPSPEDSICGTVTSFDSQTMEFYPTYSSLVGIDILSGNPVEGPAVHNSISATVNSVLEGQETFATMYISDNGLSDIMKLDLNCDQAAEWPGNTLTPVADAATGSGLSECISELKNIGTLTRTQKGLFSELGIEDLLNGTENSNFEDNKSQKTDCSSSGLACSWARARANLMQPVSNIGKTNHLVHKQEIFPKSQVGLWIDDNHSVNNGKAVLPSRPQKPEEPTRMTRKSLKRPKDRQQIQDRIKELRGIIPHGGKCSIDSLLDRTIKYMLFLQSITKYADKLQENNNEPKLIEQGNGVVLKDKIVGDSKTDDGFTWAFEVGGQTLVCPIVVEDMSPAGQMLIEMRCEEQGLFLEIADIIRGFGLNILKGKMEIRESRIWARFIVEAKRHVTRLDVFWSLIQLVQVQQTTICGMDSDSAGIPSLEMPVAMSMAETVGR
ncbi:hypothetical protein L6164_028361 [Bauhinia variegata]|uniref:Uncharacterized protein n=1 Tax=Bauhinia variegata TaxID=167791 RepID=A0ACB9LVW2_BAUVA|nr:hypothetical protein L6164_028361 [Bauhinia variegata]